MKLGPLPSLQSVREQRAFAVARLAELAEVDIGRLDQLERGASANKGELQRLASILGVPQYALLSAEVEVERLIPDFRFASTSESDIGRAGLAAIYEADELRVFLRTINDHLRRNTSFRAHDLELDNKSRFNTTRAEEAAEALRDQIHFSFNDLFSPEGSDALFARIRGRIEEAGIAVILGPLRSETFRGFCLTDTKNPIIFLNISNHYRSSRVFTLAHELAHIFVHQEGISDPFMLRSNVEAICNRMAASLMPETDFKKYVKGNPQSRQSVRKWVIHLSNELNLSQQSIAVRIDQLGLSEDNFYAKWRSSLPKLPPENITATINDDLNDEPDERGIVTSSKRSVVARKYGFYVLNTLRDGHEKLGISRYDIQSFTGIKPDVLAPALELANSKRLKAR